MPFCSFSEGAAVFDATPIENMFLMEYLPAATEECLKVYLYARMVALHPELGGDLAGVAKALRMDEDAVYDAMSYWERQGLARRLSDRPPTYELLPVRAEPSAGPMDQDYYEYRDYNIAMQACFPGTTLLHPQEYKTALDWVKLMGFEQSAVLLALENEVKSSRSKAPDPARLFKRLDKKMLKWAERGILTEADMTRELRYEGPVRDTARQVARRLAIRREPTPEELECVGRWLGEWHFTPQQVLDACEETTKSRTPSFAYLDAILKSRLAGDAALREGLVAALKELDAAAAQPTPDQLARYAALRGMGFEAETIRLAAVQCHRKKKTRIEDLEWMLDKWRERGLFTPEAAETYVRDMREKTARVRALLERCGLERRPALDDLALYERWTAQFDGDVIEYAAECARGMRVPMRFMDKLLSDWDAQGVKTLEDARNRRDAARAARKPDAAAPANPALNYEQRQTGDDYGKDLFVDLDHYGEGGEGA